jgi:hypothetical protein
MITKRQLGTGMLIIALIGIVGLLAVDLIGAGDFQGIGPAQRLGLLVCGVVALIGATLIPLGDRPA